MILGIGGRRIRRIRRRRRRLSEAALEFRLLALGGRPEPVLEIAEGVGEGREGVRAGAVVGREQNRGGQARDGDGDVANQAVFGARIHRLPCAQLIVNTTESSSNAVCSRNLTKIADDPRV